MAVPAQEVPYGYSWLQVRAWDSTLGATYEDVAALAIGGYGESAPFYARGHDPSDARTTSRTIRHEIFQPAPRCSRTIDLGAAGRGGCSLRDGFLVEKAAVRSCLRFIVTDSRMRVHDVVQSQLLARRANGEASPKERRRSLGRASPLSRRANNRDAGSRVATPGRLSFEVLMGYFFQTDLKGQRASK